MSTVGVPRHLWSSFLQSFTRRHRGWLATVGIAAQLPKSEVKTRDIAFAEVSVEPKQPDGEEVSILLRAAGGVRLWVDQPETIELREDDEAVVLVIQSNDGRETVVQFGARALPARAAP